MLQHLPSVIVAPISMSIMLFNTLFWAVWLYVMLGIKLLLPTKGGKRWMTERMAGFGQNWISINSWLMASLQGVRFRISGLETLQIDKSYLVCANHQSWVDILVLQKVFNRRIPFLRFFLKQELLYVPVLGGVWWALDYPFMKRYSKDYLAKHPEKRGKDLEATKLACERFRGAPISVLNFFEGTRYSTAKNAKQSEYVHLLPPKAGGAAFVLESMGDQFDAIVDVTIFYPRGVPSMWDLFRGKFREVWVEVRRLPVQAEFLGGNYLEDEKFRTAFQDWVRRLWLSKDRRLAEMKSESLEFSQFARG